MSEVQPSHAAFFTLMRHHLLEPLHCSDALKVVDDILGLNAQGALNYQLSLSARVEGLSPTFIRESLDRRVLVRTWMMRNTVHIVSSDLFPMIQTAVRDSLVEEWNRWTVRGGSKASPSSWDRLYPSVLKALEDGPLAIGKISERLNMSERAAQIVVHRVIREMSLKGLVCHASSLGPWHHETEHRYARVDRWLPDFRRMNEREAKRELVLRYLKAYGPASMQDFCYWSGMKMRDSKPIFDSLNPCLGEIRIAGQRQALLAHEEDVEAVVETEPVSVVRLLPQFDALIMGHKDKTRFLDSEHRAKVFLPTAEVAAVMLVDGRVQGVWKMRKRGKSWVVELAPFMELTEEHENQLENEIQRIREFTGFEIERNDTW